MKKLIFILFVLISFNGCAQNTNIAGGALTADTAGGNVRVSSNTLF